jgi:hypothetical protein
MPHTEHKSLPPPKEKVLLFGHHRSGNHYLAALININFFGKEDYKFLCNNRQHTLISGIPSNDKYLYIYRNFEDVSKSCFEMRARFGLDVATYEEFLSNRYCDMYTGKIAVNVHVNFIYNEFNTRSGSIFFHNFKKTPLEWHTAHLEHYNELAKKTDLLLLVSYDRLKSDFYDQMLEIAQFFGTAHRKFENVTQKVGYWPNK